MISLVINKSKVRHRREKNPERARGPDRLAMGRGRRAGPSSGDDSDDGASPVGGLSSQLGKGSKKQWKPGMSVGAKGSRRTCLPYVMVSLK